MRETPAEAKQPVQRLCGRWECNPDDAATIEPDRSHVWRMWARPARWRLPRSTRHGLVFRRPQPASFCIGCCEDLCNQMAMLPPLDALNACHTAAGGCAV